MTTPTTWIAVAKRQDLALDHARVVRADGKELALLSTLDGLFALDNVCPHAGGPLGEGSVQGRTVTCPLHGWQFEGKTGACLSERRPPQQTYAVKISGDDVLVEMPAPEAAESENAPAKAPADPSTKKSPIEVWKQAKHGIDVWPDVLLHARERTPMSEIDASDLERMKWYGYFHRKNNDLCVHACGECETHRGEPMIHLEYVDREASTQTTPIVCMHCEDPCAKVCPADAIIRGS